MFIADRVRGLSLPPVGTLFAVVFIMATLYPAIWFLPYVQRAYADGLTAENLQASIGNRDVSLFVKVNPPVLTTASSQDTFIQFRFFDANGNKTIQHVTYNIIVTKASAGKDQNNILNAFFHAHNGQLKLNVKPVEGPMTIDAERYGENSYLADPAGIVSVRGPVLLEGGLYHFQIKIFSIDTETNIFRDKDAPKFDSWLSVGNISTESISYNNQSYNATIISYYDKTQDFNFDPAKKVFTWAMPFDWNATRIQQNNIFVHQEVRIPKSLAGIGDSPYYYATANGQVLTGRKIAIDPYSYQSEITLHYLLNKNDILQLASKAGDSKQMTFLLAPASEAPVETTSEMVTDTGGIGVAVDWSPDPLDAAKESTVNLRFSDGFSGRPLNADVQYSLSILDDGGKSVYSKDNLTAKGGTDTQAIDFPNNKKYDVQVTVKGLIKEGQQQADNTRNGIARGIVVVPEFPATSATALVAVGTIIGMLAIVARRASIFRSFVQE